MGCYEGSIWFDFVLGEWVKDEEEVIFSPFFSFFLFLFIFCLCSVGDAGVGVGVGVWGRDLGEGFGEGKVVVV